MNTEPLNTQQKKRKEQKEKILSDFYQKTGYVRKEKKNQGKSITRILLGE